MSEKIIIVIPAFNEQESLNQLLGELNVSLREFSESGFSVVVVNDGSIEKLSINRHEFLPVSILNLHRNIGHQKAIAIGLAYVKEKVPCDKILIMDGDGEDRPEDVLSLLRESRQFPDKIIFALRRSRQEGSGFKFFYSLYKFAFRIFTGKKIAFGNFLLMPKPLLDKAVYYSEIWNHLAGGLLKAGLPYRAVMTDGNQVIYQPGHSRLDIYSSFGHADRTAPELSPFSFHDIPLPLISIATEIHTRTSL
jgi:polyisoprenyl-phosphate glycosyltransferase